MKIVAISDTHGMHRKFKIPDGDLFIHAGDFTNVGELDQVKDFNDWLGELPHTHKVVIAGNHDLSLARAPEITFNSDFWVFHHKGSMARKAHWAQIPEDLDILITHGPPYRILDYTIEGEYAGDLELVERLYQLDNPPKYHLFGHIHEGYGQRIDIVKPGRWDGPQIRFGNISAVDRMMVPRENPCVEFEIY